MERLRANGYFDSQAGESAGEPFDLFADASITPEPVLTCDMLPASIAEFAFDEAIRKGVEPAMMAIPALGVCAAAIHDGIKLQPRQHDTTWTESARLWLAMLAEPGGKKTPALNAALQPLRDIEQCWRRADAAALKVHEATVQHRKSIAQKIVQMSDPGAPEQPLEQPSMRRLMAGDTTMEQLAHILADNERGVLIVHDELAGFIGGFDAYRGNGAHKDRAAALELWNGGYRTVDRVKGNVAVSNWSASIIGGIQPDKLREMASSSKMAGDGLLQRFLLFTGKTLGPGEDRTPDSEALKGYSAVVQTLVELQPCPVVRLSEGARPYWQEVERLALALAQQTTIPALQTHLAKVPGLFARLLLTFHAIECAPLVSVIGLAEVSRATGKQGRDLMVKFFLPHATRIYSDLFRSADAEGELVRRVARCILAHGEETITERDVYRGCRELRGPEHAAERHRAMAALVRYSWVDPIGLDKWKVNPAIYERFAAVQDQERKRRHEARCRLQQSVETLQEAYGNDPVAPG